MPERSLFPIRTVQEDPPRCAVWRPTMRTQDRAAHPHPMSHHPLVITREAVRDIASAVRGAPRTADGSETLAHHLRELGFDVVEEVAPAVDVVPTVQALLAAKPGTSTQSLVATVRHLYAPGTSDSAVALHLHDLGAAHGWVPRGESWWPRADAA